MMTKKMTGLCALLVAMVMFSSCGKKEEKKDTAVAAKSSKELASVQDVTGKKDIPVYTVENESLLDEEAISDFAFIDDNDGFIEQQDKAEMAVASAQELEDSDNDIVMPMIKEEKSTEVLASREEMEDEDFEEFDRIQFEFNRDKPQKDQQGILKKNCLKASSAIKQGKDVVISGHTCQMGSASYNLALSQKRAEAVKAEMVKNDIPADKIKTLGAGYESPLVWSDKTNRIEKIRELSPNRRAEITLN